MDHLGNLLKYPFPGSRPDPQLQNHQGGAWESLLQQVLAVTLRVKCIRGSLHDGEPLKSIKQGEDGMNGQVSVLLASCADTWKVGL